MNAKQFLEQKKQQQETISNRPYVGGGYGQTKSAGEIFVNSQAYKNFLANGKSSSDNVAIPAFPTKALVTSTSGGRLLGESDYLTTIIGAGQQQMTMRSLLAVQPTQNNAIEYLRETGFVNASAIAPEGTLKAESAITFEEVSSTIKTIAHWIPCTRQSVSDIAGLQAHIDQRLIYGLQVTEEAQILYGDGVGENIQGIMTTPTIQTYTAITGDTKIDTVRRALSLVYLAGFPPTGVVMHPTDWEDIELLKDDGGNYILANVNMGSETRLFRVPVVLSTSIVEGEFLVGSFGLGAQLFDREQANVRISEHHADYFVKNQIAILAEERIGLAIFRPESFVRGDFTPAV
jgi:HK97 family phage major capsid protein